VIAAALAGSAPVIVTGDRDLLKGEQLTEWLAERGIEVIRPVERSGVSITDTGRRLSPAESPPG
jgi:predicted nucleic acid-binding protein